MIAVYVVILFIFFISLLADSSIRSLLKKINYLYYDIFKGKSLYVKIFQGSFILINEALTIFIVYKMTARILKVCHINIGEKFLIFSLVFFIIHYVMGAVMLFFYGDKKRNLTGDFLTSYFLIVTAVFFIMLFYKQVGIFSMSFIIADFISYLLNIKLLIMFMLIGRKKYKDEIMQDEFFLVFSAAIILVIMLIVNLYIGVVIVNAVYRSSFSNNPGNFDLFYYTVVTFTTIGFGDIVPLNKAAKAMAVVISCTSILCLTVFLSSIYSIRKR